MANNELTHLFYDENDDPVSEKLRHLQVIAQKVQNSKISQGLYPTRQTKSENFSRINLAKDRAQTTARFSESQFFE